MLCPLAGFKPCKCLECELFHKFQEACVFWLIHVEMIQSREFLQEMADLMKRIEPRL